MDNKIYIILGSHNHLPHGSGDDEFEYLYHNEIKPLITALYKFPRIAMVFHYSGVLLYWIERRRPELFMLLEDLINRKQVELLGGGFYDPFFPLLPLPDKLGQIEMLTTYLRRHFGKRPQGCWLPALAWEQNLVGPLNTCGMGYTFLAEEIFDGAGSEENAFFVPCITEDQGKLITVFPVVNRLRHELAHNKTSRLFEKLSQNLNTDRPRIVTIFPDFVSGEDDGSRDLFYHRIFEELSQAAAYFEFITPGRVYKGLQNPDKRYFSVYRGADLQRRPMPRQSLIDYPEANGIYAKMMFTRVLINQLRGDKSRKRTAVEELWKAQGGDLFNSFPEGEGDRTVLYRHSVRKAAYRALLEAEKITREGGTFVPSLSTFDFDFDGQGEYLFQGDPVNCYISLMGASIFELDYLPRTWNYLDTLVRQGPSDKKGRRAAFVDYLAPLNVNLDQAIASGFPGARFCGEERFEAVEMDRVHGRVFFRLPARSDGPFRSVEIEKIYSLKKDTLTLEYNLINRGQDPEEFNFIPALDLSFPGEGEAFLRILALKRGEKEKTSGINEYKNVEGIEFQDIKNEVSLTLTANRSFDTQIFPVTTRCRLNGKTGDFYQSTGIVPLMPVFLKQGESWETELKLRIRH
jgi:hypothetical protein